MWTTSGNLFGAWQRQVVEESLIATDLKRARVSTAFSTGPGIDGGNNKGILRVLPRLHFDREHWVDRVRTIY